MMPIKLFIPHDQDAQNTAGRLIWLEIPFEFSMTALGSYLFTITKFRSAYEEDMLKRIFKNELYNQSSG